MIDFSLVKELVVADNPVKMIQTHDGSIIWVMPEEENQEITIKVEKIISNTVSGETTFENEKFLILDIYPKKNGTVTVTYGNYKKTITDISGAEYPNAQQVYFGTFNNVTDPVETPDSGILTIKGDCDGFGNGHYRKFSDAKSGNSTCYCIKELRSLGQITRIPEEAFAYCNHYNFGKLPPNLKEIGKQAFYVSVLDDEPYELIQEIIIPENVTYIGSEAFVGNFRSSEYGGVEYCYLKTLIMRPTVPPTLEIGLLPEDALGAVKGTISIIVPKGCVEVYKTADFWSYYADYIVEES